MNLLATRLTNRLVKVGAVSSDSADIYIYGLEVLFSSLFSTILLLLIGTLLGFFVETVTFFIVFISLRSFTGGFHANTYLLCMSITSIIYISVIIASIYVAIGEYVYIVVFPLGMISIIAKAPVRNPNKPLTHNEYNRHKVISIIVYLTIIGVGLLLMNYHQLLSRVVLFTLIADILLMFVRTRYRTENK